NAARAGRARHEPGIFLWSGYALAGGIRGCFSLRRDRGSTPGDRRDEAGHGIGAPDGPPYLRRRGFWKDRGGDSRGIQGGHERKEGSLDCPDDRSVTAAI